MNDDKTSSQPTSLSERIYPQPTSKAGRGQTYNRTPIALPDLPIEHTVTPIPWRQLVFITGLAALVMSAVDWGLGVWGGTVRGSLALAMVGAVLLMIIIAALSWAFYKTFVAQLTQSRIPYARMITWGSILFILPATQGLRWLIMPELLSYDMPISSHGIIYIIATITVWVGTVTGIIGILLRSPMSEQRRYRAIFWIVISPYFVVVPVGIVELTKII